MIAVTHGGSPLTNADDRFVLPTAVPGSESIDAVKAPRRGPVYGSRFAVASDHPYASLGDIDAKLAAKLG